MDNGGMTKTDLLIMAEEDCVYWKSEAIRLRKELDKRHGTCRDCRHWHQPQCPCFEPQINLDFYCKHWEKKQ